MEIEFEWEEGVMKTIRRMPTEKEFEELVKEHGADCKCCGKLKREDVEVEIIFDE